jgi:hypothetical protein
VNSYWWVFLRSTESVREISLRAGQAFVTQYAETSVVMLNERERTLSPFLLTNQRPHCDGASHQR